MTKSTDSVEDEICDTICMVENAICFTLLKFYLEMRRALGRMLSCAAMTTVKHVTLPLLSQQLSMDPILRQPRILNICQS